VTDKENQTMTWDISLISLNKDPLTIPGHPEHEGEENYIKELSRYLGGIGLKIDVYSRRENTQQPNLEEYSRGTRVVRIPIGPPQRIQEVKTIPFLKEIAEWIPSLQIQNGMHYDLVHSYSYASGPVGVHLKNLWGIPLVHTFHSLSIVEEELLGSSKQSPEIRRKIEKLICSNADRIIAKSSQEKTDLMDLYRVDPEIISVVPSGVNLSFFQPLSQSESRQEIAFPDDIFLITFVGELNEQSGLDVLLNAIHLADKPGIQAVIVGGPPSNKSFLNRSDLSQEPYKKYVEMIDEFGLDKQITFTGGKPINQLAKYFSAGDITVVPPQYDPYGLIAKEALSCGTGVIASRVGGLIAAVQENHVGSLFEPGNAEQLAEKIKIFYDQPKITKEMRDNARLFAEENFSWKSVAIGVSTVYEEMLAEPNENPET
jgi:glycosyltransferase involved in cell wall biosynthesis